MTIPPSWYGHASEIAQRAPTVIETVKPFLALASYVDENGWGGACHAVAAVLYVLFWEVGVSSTLCLGEAQLGRIAFDHSWVEVDGAVFDVAIMGTLMEEVGAPPTFRNRDLDTRRESRVRYGVTTGQERQALANAVLATPFHRFMSRYPDHPEGLWAIARLVGMRAGLSLSVRQLKERHGPTEWCVR